MCSYTHNLAKIIQTYMACILELKANINDFIILSLFKVSTYYGFFILNPVTLSLLQSPDEITLIETNN